MNGEPILTIDEFAGMGDGNLVYNNGFLPEVVNGKSIMTSGFTTKNVIGYANQIEEIGDVINFITVKTINSGDDYVLYIGSSGDIYTASEGGTAALRVPPAEIHSTAAKCLFELENNDIIYVGISNIGYGVRGKTTGGSTTTIVDTTRHFGGVNKGVYDNGTTYAQYDYVYYEGSYYAATQSTTGNLPTNDTYWLETNPNEIAVGYSVTNLKTGKEETITSITTTTHQNDTLNFDATTATSNGDEYIAWNDNYHDLSDGITTKTWQGIFGLWVRQVKQYGNQYLILNGNYLAMLSADGLTLDTTFKQLPLRNQALCMEVSNDKLLVASEYKGQGKLNLWNGSSNNWDNIIDTDYPITALISYNSGWLFVSRGILYYTDGYNIEKLSSLNLGLDVGGDRASFVNYLEPAYPDGICYFDNKLYFANSFSNEDMIDNGIYCFDFDKGWTFIENHSGYSYVYGKIPAYSIGFSPAFKRIIVGGENVINEIETQHTHTYTLTNGRIPYSFINYINLPQETQVKGVGLNLFRPIKETLYDGAEKKANIYINIGDGSRGLLDYVTINEASGVSNKLKINGTSYKNNEVGDELIIDRKDVLQGERFFITAIENKGTTNELWTLDRNIGASFTGYAKILRVKNVETKVISYDELNKEILFNGNSFGFLSNKMFLEVVVVDDGDNPMPISITSIKIYG